MDRLDGVVLLTIAHVLISDHLLNLSSAVFYAVCELGQIPLPL